MDAATFTRELARNRAAYFKLKNRLQNAGAGRYAAIAEGRLIAIRDTFDEATAEVKQLATSPEHFLVFPVDEEPAFEAFDDFLVEGH